MRNYFRSLFGKDKRTPEEKVRDGIRKQVEEYESNNDGMMVSHTVRPWYYGNKLNTTITDHFPERKRKFH